MSRDHFITRTHQFLFFVALLSYSSCFQNLTARQFRNEKQPVVLTLPANRVGYEIGKPSLKDGQLIFNADKSLIKYFCSANESRDVVRVQYEANSNVYEYHECVHAPNVVLRMVPKGDPLISIWSQKKIYQIGYELEVPNFESVVDKPEESEKKTCTRWLNKIPLFGSNSNTSPPISTPLGQFAPLIWFIYNDKAALPAIVHYHLISAQSLAIETNYMMGYKNVSPVTGEEFNTDVDIKIKETNNAQQTFGQCEQQRLAARLGLLNRKLVPHDDLLFFSWKPAAFYDALTAPMWKIHRIKWDQVEQFLRRLANARGDLEIFAGVKGILNGNTMKTYWSYNGNRKRSLGFVIPAYFWKIVISRKYNFGVIIVLNNNPLDEHSEKLCPDIGYENNWIFVDDDYITGSVYVCALNDKNTKKLFPNYKDFLNEYKLRSLKSELPPDALQAVIDNIYNNTYEFNL